MQHYILKRDRFSSHSFISRVVREISPKKILDVGCSTGLIARSLGKEWRDRLYGVDICELAVSKAKKHYKKVWVLDIERNIPGIEGKFDCLIFGDVLEHLKDPERVLGLLLEKSLISGGIVIVSLPNVVNWYVRAQLALGNFNYQNRGLMDKTHLRFFTWKSARKMLAQAGLRIVEQQVSPIPLPLIFKKTDVGQPFAWLHSLNNLVTNLRPGLFGYQLLFVCRKNKK